MGGTLEDPKAVSQASDYNNVNIRRAAASSSVARAVYPTLAPSDRDKVRRSFSFFTPPFPFLVVQMFDVSAQPRCVFNFFALFSRKG